MINGTGYYTKMTESLQFECRLLVQEKTKSNAIITRKNPTSGKVVPKRNLINILNSVHTPISFSSFFLDIFGKWKNKNFLMKFI